MSTFIKENFDRNASSLMDTKKFCFLQSSSKVCHEYVLRSKYKPTLNILFLFLRDFGDFYSEITSSVGVFDKRSASSSRATCRVASQLLYSTALKQLKRRMIFQVAI